MKAFLPIFIFYSLVWLYNSMSANKIVSDYGSWKSPITGEQLVGGNCKTISELRASPKGRPFWLEQTFPDGKQVLFEQTPDGRIVQWSSSNLSISNSVYEYGGGSTCIGSGGLAEGCIFISHSGGIWELSEPGAEPRPMIRNAHGQDVRHADIVAHGDYVYAVQDTHPPSGYKGSPDPTTRLVRVHIQSGEHEVLSEGADFYAEPRVSSDGHWLAWIQWSNPYMTWEQTSVHVMELGHDGKHGKARTILDNGRSNFGLAWSDGPTLWTLSDIEGQWNVHLVNHTSSEGDLGHGIIPGNIADVSSEIGDPLWEFNMDRPYVILDAKLNRAIVAVADGLWELNGHTKHSQIGSVHKLGFTNFDQLSLSADGHSLFCLASGPQRAVSLLHLDLSIHPYKAKVLRESRDHTELAKLPISVPESLIFKTDGGIPVQGYFYAPYNHTQTAPEVQLPPALLLVHGGPTGRTRNALDMEKQFYTSRGFAIFDINYRGSSGFGREFRDYLIGQWGIVDRDDMINGAKLLISTGRVDPTKVCIMGQSSGGFTALSVLMHSGKMFAGAVSIYGAADLEQLYKSSHKFEKANTGRRVAPYPEGIEVYRQRSPLHHIARIQSPVAFLHGTADTVVPVEQSIVCHQHLKQNGVPTLLKLFPGEGHGFQKAITIIESVRIAYTFLCKAMGIQPSEDLELKTDNM